VKYYKFEKAGVLISYGITDGVISDNCTEITKAEYDAIVADQAAIDKASADKRAEEAETAQKAAEKAVTERKATVDDWIAKVKAGTSTLANVPEEYRYQVQEATDPTPTNEELKVSISNAQDAINFLLENGLANGGVS